MSTTDGRDRRHAEHVAFLQAFDPGIPTKAGDWCDIRNSYPVGQQYRGSYSVFDKGAELTFTINPDATGRIVQLTVLDVDRTAEALAHGGGSITLTPNSRYGYDCKTSDYYLAWGMTGQFVDWAAELVEQAIGSRPSDFLLYARYYGHDDPKKWFYFYLLTWHYAELVPV